MISQAASAPVSLGHQNTSEQRLLDFQSSPSTVSCWLLPHNVSSAKRPHPFFSSVRCWCRTGRKPTRRQVVSIILERETFMFMFRNVSRITPFVVLAALSSALRWQRSFYASPVLLRLAIGSAEAVRLRNTTTSLRPNIPAYKHHFVIRTRRIRNILLHNPILEILGPLSDHGRRAATIFHARREGPQGKAGKRSHPRLSPPTGLPPFPESTDARSLDLPPDDLPTIAGA